MPRLFTAFLLPHAVSERLSLLRGGLVGARWVDPSDYHITLSFIGDIDDRLADEIASALCSVRHPFLEIRLQSLGAFGKNRPKALYAAVSPSPALLDLQASQEHLLRRLGVSIEPRTYTPHVTLARLSNVSARAVADWLSVHDGGEAHQFRAERFALMSSRESRGGGPYITEEIYVLGR